MRDYDGGSLHAKHHSPTDEVYDLVTKYESMREPSAALRHILHDSDFYRLFCEVIERQISIIMSRSQAFDDGHVTVYDKCLIELCRNGKAIDNLGGQELYIREFIGIDPDAPEQAIEETLAKHVWMKSILAKYSPRSFPATATDAVTAKDSSPQNAPFSHSYIDDYDMPTTENPVDDENIKLLLGKYFQAKYAFYNLKSTNYQENASAAKYLRDSAENILYYLNMHKLTPPDLIRELREVSDYANDKSVEFLGGKKRRFEIKKDSTGGRPRNRPTYSRGPSPYYRHPHDRERYKNKRKRGNW